MTGRRSTFTGYGGLVAPHNGGLLPGGVRDGSSAERWVDPVMASKRALPHRPPYPVAKRPPPVAVWVDCGTCWGQRYVAHPVPLGWAKVTCPECDGAGKRLR